MKLLLRLLGLACLVLSVGAAVADDQALKQTQPIASSLGVGSSDYRLGGGDLIEISAYGVKDFQHTVRISASGVVKLPLLGQVSVTGKTAGDLEKHLEDLLRADLIQDPTVSVFVVEYKARMIFVLGAVRQPGQYQVIKRLRVIDVLTMAGGLDQNAGDELLIQHQRPTAVAAADGQQTGVIRRIDLKALLTDGDLELNVALEDGDVITVPEKIVDYYYVVGEVNGPGAFVLPDTGPILVSQALARAGGPMRTAKMKSGTLVRYNEGQERQQIPVNFSAIFAGKTPDVELHPNDIIFVPGSQFKTFGYAMLQVLPSTVTRVTMWR